MNRQSAARTLKSAKFDTRDMAKHAGAASALLRAMASEHRLMVLCSLVQGEKSVGELLEKVPLAQSALSQHLAVLRREGLVATRREGQSVRYALKTGPALDIIRVLYDNFCCAVPGASRA